MKTSSSLRIFANALLVGLASTLFLGCASGGRARIVANEGLVASLKSQADDWDRAIVRKDRTAIAGNMTDDFRQIRSNGSIADKETFLRDITSPDLVIDPYVVEDFDVRVYGEVALLCGRTKMSGRYAGEPFATHYRFIDTYVRRDGTWKVCGVQITTIPTPAHSG